MLEEGRESVAPDRNWSEQVVDCFIAAGSGNWEPVAIARRRLAMAPGANSLRAALAGLY